jgi:predicted PurR-regulated permease PerM
MSFAIASFLKPFVAVLVIALVAAPIKGLVQRRMKDGRLKRLLLLELGS